MTFFAVAAPGLEKVVADELREASFQKVEPVDGGVLFVGDLREMARANLHLRCATRILLRLGEFLAPGRRELLRGVRALDWSPWLDRRAPLTVRVACHKSRLYHTGLVEEVVREAIGVPAPLRSVSMEGSSDSRSISSTNAQPRGAFESADRVEDGADDGPTLHVRIVRDLCTVSLDTSGALLHRRGYREELSRAPLRETLAAGLLHLAGWDGEEALADPMCGSGTIAIEAALIALNRAPGHQRSFAFEDFPSFERTVLELLREKARESETSLQTTILASDLDSHAVEATRRNAMRAGVAHLLDLQVSDVAATKPPAPRGLLLTNPPYGRRIRTRRGPDEPAHRQLAAALTGPFAKWRRFVLGPASLRSSLRLGVASSHPLTNGGLRVELMEMAERPRKPKRRYR